ncbi:alpha/beta fold hydrolase [Acidovorax sp. ACV01]|uniref:alpha/beta fold hydrolase n=1 Tax=Acidovorax sp. ACV01 TaxID=2769311 RepID=UPI00178097D6|nr:alpha/beta fold hydrolase [Acidovorax sp. ACV01]MBD9393723.1 alpha/beta fold hydrolase [Acidovorax sp. ACV01]
MKRIALLSAAATLALGATALYYGAPSLFKEPLLSLNRSLSGMEEKTISAAMHTVHYLDSGTAQRPTPGGSNVTPIVLLHGIFAEKDHWVDFARPLTSQYRVIAPDIPGFGESTRRDDQAYDYAAHVTRLAAFLDALGLPRVHLAGNSMGGTIAALFALQHPERVASLAFIGAPHGIRSPQPSAMDRLIDAGQRPLVAHDAAAFDAMMALVFEKHPFLPHPILYASEQDALRNATSNTRLWDAQLKDRYLLEQHLSKLQHHPTLVLWGESDRVFDRSGLLPLQKLLPQAQAEALPGIGHLPMMEAPAETAQRYARFLSPLAHPAQPDHKGFSASIQ